MKRRISVLSVIVLLFAACGSNSRQEGGPKSRTMQQLADSTLQSYTLVVGNSEFLTGPNRLVFAMLDASQNLVRDLELEVYFGLTESATALGPVKATFEDDGLEDRSFYRASLTLAGPGKWLILVRERGAGTAQVKGAGSTIEAKPTTTTPKPGEKAIPVATPTTADHKGVDPICTREPNDHMHELSVDTAISNGKPSVIVFGTPALCTSRVCGPVVDQVMRVEQDHSKKVNFVHVEVFTDRTGKTFTEGMRAWRLQTEPWTFVVDAKGTITSAFEGPVTTGELKTALKAVL